MRTLDEQVRTNPIYGYDRDYQTAARRTMRTNIMIDDKLMADTLRVTGLKSKREAIELGLRTLVRLDQQEKIRQARGKFTWQGDLDTLRNDK